MSSIIQPWAAALGLRHQGVLVSAVRGCDGAPREDASKYLIRVFRGVLLQAHCKDVEKAVSFMAPYHAEDWADAKDDFFDSIDHYPNHWLLHWAHACEIVGFKHPDAAIRIAFRSMYLKIVKKFHMLPEEEEDLDQRLNADEKTFGQMQDAG